MRVTVVVCVCVSVCVSVCLSVTVLAATYQAYVSKVRRHTVSYSLLKICTVWTLLKAFHLGDMALVTRLFLDKKHTNDSYHD